MTAEEMACIYAGDMEACKTAAVLTEYGRRWRNELANHPMADELRRIYRERMEALNGRTALDK